METYIYRCYGEHLCAIVLSEDGKKFVEDIERFCTSWELLIDEAKSGFEGFPFYEETVNYDVGFWDRYLDIFEGCDEEYELLLSASDGAIVVDPEALENKGAYFDTLADVMKIAERYDFSTFSEVVYSQDYMVLSSESSLLVLSNVKIPFEPRNEQKVLRDLIRERLRGLDSFESQVLYASYGCTEPQNDDIENTLFYNIGISAFNNILTEKTSVYFERISPNEVGFHHQR